MAALAIQLDRARRTPLAAQIYSAIREGIENGRLASGARLPSWRDLAAQLGVSRGTVRVAYERLIAEQFAIGLGPAGTRVAERPSRSSKLDWSPEAPRLPGLFYAFGSAPLAFQMGVPSQDAFPFKLWSRILARETRRAAAAPVAYPDPLGDPELRKEVVGSFSKTISPALRLGFIVVPPELGRRFGEFAACLAPAPAAAVQRAVAEFLREGHYLRHLRRMKRLYAARRESLLRCLGELASDSIKGQATAGLAVVILLPEFASDVDIALRALQFGLAPAPLSPWYMQSWQQGLLLGVTNLNERRLPADCRRLLELAR